MTTTSDTWNEHKDKIFFFLTIVLAILFFFETVRELVGTVYSLNLTDMGLNSSITWIVVFFAPLLLLIGLARIKPHILLYSSLIIISVCRVSMSLDLHGAVYIKFLGLSMVSLGIFIPVLAHTFRHRFSTATEDRIFSPLGPVTALVTAMGIDLALRALGNTFDISVYGFTPHRTSSLLISLPMVLLFLVSFFMLVRGEKIENRGNSGDKEDSGIRKGKNVPLRTRLTVGIGTGVMSYLYFFILCSPNKLARWTGDGYTMVNFLLATGVVLAAAAVLILPSNWFDKRGVRLGAGLLFFASICVLVLFTLPFLATFLAAISLFLLPLLLGTNLRTLSARRFGVRDVALVMFLSNLVLLVLLFLTIATLTHAHLPMAGFLRGALGTLVFIATLIMLFCFTLQVVLPLDGKNFRNKKTGIRTKSGPSWPKNVLVLCIALLYIFTTFGNMIHTSQPEKINQHTDELVLMTYNVHQAFGNRNLLEPYELLEPIQEIDPDILVLEECDTNRFSSMNTDIVKWLGDKMDMYVYFGPGNDMQIYGLSILSKYPLLNASTHSLTSVEDERVFVQADVYINGQTITVYGVHIGLIDEDRTTQTSEMLDIMALNPNPKIMMGDFNSYPDSVQIVEIQKHYWDAWNQSGNDPLIAEGYTYDALAPYERIDYIFLSKNSIFLPKSCHVGNEYKGSDHLPLWTMVELRD